MLSLHEVEVFLQRTPAHLQEIVLELRNVIVSAVPDAVEVIRWGGLSYFHGRRGGIISAGICQIGIHEGYVRLDFIHGIHLPDPHHLLVGNQKSKRFVKITSFDDAPWDYFKELILAASKFEPRLLSVK